VAGGRLPVSSQLVVLSDGPRVVVRSSASSLEVLRGDTVVARASGPSGPDVPLSLRAGTAFPAQTLPAEVALVGCDGAPLPPGAYRLRAVVAYGNDPLNGAPGGSGGSGGSGGFVLVSDPPLELTVT
jgi:hypothetical protein